MLVAGCDDRFRGKDPGSVRSFWLRGATEDTALGRGRPGGTVHVSSSPPEQDVAALRVKVFSLTPRADSTAPDLVRAHGLRRSASRELALSGAHLAALSAFAFAQPLFDLLDDSADFFAVRGSTRSEIVLFALAVVLLPPAALLLVEALAGLASRTLGRILHLVFVGGLAAVVAIQVLKRATSLTSTEALIGLAVLAGAIAALLYARLAPIRSFLTVLAPAPLVFLVLFLVVSPVSELTLARGADVRLANVGARAPVVMVVFDEFPVTDLLTADGEIDAERFPSFARLARESTWFRNTTSVSRDDARGSRDHDRPLRPDRRPARLRGAPEEHLHAPRRRLSDERP